MISQHIKPVTLKFFIFPIDCFQKRLLFSNRLTFINKISQFYHKINRMKIELFHRLADF